MACFHHSCLLKGVWRCLVLNVGAWKHATSFSVLGVVCGSKVREVKMMERKRVQQGTRERVGSTVRSRSGGFALSSSRPYSGKTDFDIISSSRGSGWFPRPWRHRSLTAAQAATGFTCNCVLGFERNDQFQEMKRDTRLRKVLSRHFAYLDPYFTQGAWSYLS